MKKALSILNKSSRLVRTTGFSMRNSSVYINNLSVRQQSLYTAPMYRFSQTNETPKTEEVEKRDTENMEFKTETKRLLDIVAKSIYTDKDVFIRELLSNCSDALEKQRFLQVSGRDTGLGEPLQISVTCNEAKRQIIIQDTGIGMTREELIQNLGTIARSGSKEFVETTNDATAAENIIGQFGVGFYSSFIVGDTIEVISKSGADSNSDAHLWVSDGLGRFEISKISNPGFQRGTKIIIHLRPDAAKFAKSSEIQKIIQRYSNFINYPIQVNGEKVNLVSAIWSRDKRDITDQDYKNFWEHISGQKIDYKFKTHFVSDVPLSIKSILYIPSTHMEKYGMNMEDFDLNLYSRKVLIKAKARELLPNYLRFVKGVVDCEDIPLNISREHYQDNALMTRLRNLLTKRVLRLLDEEARKNPEVYLSWYNEFNMFLKEGLASDQDHVDDLMKLIRYEASWTNELVTMEDYIKKMRPGQDKIYFILSQSRLLADSSPYMEPFKGTEIPVIYIQMHVDEMVFRSMDKYKNFSFVNIETSHEEVSKDTTSYEHNKETGLPEDDVTTFCLWIKNELQPIISKVQVSKRLKDSPAIVVSPISSGMRQVMQMMDKSQSLEMMQNLTFEINPNHELITKMNAIRKSNSKMAGLLIKQLLDNSMINAGMIQDTKSYVDRVNKIMVYAIDNGLAASNMELPSGNSPAEREMEKMKIEEAKLAQEEQTAESRRDQ